MPLEKKSCALTFSDSCAFQTFSIITQTVGSTTADYDTYFVHICYEILYFFTCFGLQFMLFEFCI